MKIISFSVNSVRLRIHQLQALVDQYDPDIIGLQETKCVDDDFPIDDINSLGFEAAFFGQKTHYGVAMLSKLPMRDIKMGFSSDTPDAQRRIIAATVTSQAGNDVTVING